MNRSRLVLGTAQLGMEYGLNNPVGQPSTEEAFKILDAAVAHGIDTLDTAWAYGNAEDVIGEWLRTSKNKNVKIISKLKPHALNDYPNDTNGIDVVRKEIEKSLHRLGVEKLDGYLLHTPSYVYNVQVIEGLQKAQAEGLTDHIGVSVYDEAEALQAAELPVDFLQVPWNALDQRMDRTDLWIIAKENNVTVFARSPFLQGLLLVKPAKIPPHLSHARFAVERFQEIAAQNGLTPAQAALSFSYVRSKAAHVVFGVESVQQLQEDIKIVQRAVDAPWMSEIEEHFKDTGRAIVNPSLWTKIRT